MTEYYIMRHESGYLGNSPFWWAKKGHGYTAYIENAERFTKEEAEKTAGVPVGEKGDKYIAWPCDFIDSRLHKVFDGQDFGQFEQWQEINDKI